MMRSGTVICRIWNDMEGDFHILFHYIRVNDAILMTAAYSRYNGEITDITDKACTLKFVPDWKDRIPNV